MFQFGFFFSFFFIYLNFMRFVIICSDYFFCKLFLKSIKFDVYHISHRQYHCYLNIFFILDISVTQLVASMSGVVLGRVVEVVGSNLVRGKLFTASIHSLYPSVLPSVFIYCMNLHQFLILGSSKAMMFVKLYFRTSDIYLISLVSLDPSGFYLRMK